MTCEAVYCFDRASVLFAIYPDGHGGSRIVAEIAEGALRDLFGARGSGASLVEACRRNLDSIEAIALQRHRKQPSKAVELETPDS
jgi:hypothetical protein